MLAKLRVEGPPVPEDKEPTRVITVRLPKSLHEFLQVEAHEKCTSMNQLCISKLVQWLDSDLAASKQEPVDRRTSRWRPSRSRRVDVRARRSGRQRIVTSDAITTRCSLRTALPGARGQGEGVKQLRSAAAHPNPLPKGEGVKQKKRFGADL